MFKAHARQPAVNTVLDSQIPEYAKYPPIAAVVFAWGVNEDGQLVGANTPTRIKASSIALYLMQLHSHHPSC